MHNHQQWCRTCFRAWLHAQAQRASSNFIIIGLVGFGMFVGTWWDWFRLHVTACRLCRTPTIVSFPFSMISLVRIHGLRPNPGQVPAVEHPPTRGILWQQRFIMNSIGGPQIMVCWDYADWEDRVWLALSHELPCAIGGSSSTPAHGIQNRSSGTNWSGLGLCICSWLQFDACYDHIHW